jgi:tetratricopeptide (TPR) repeat protein
MKNWSVRSGSAAAIMLIAACVTSAHAQDPSIDRLLSKLPPPETFVKPPAQRALEQPDPALKDSLVQQIGVALRIRSFARALDLSHKLIERYPQSSGAYGLHGVVTSLLGRRAEAFAAFHKAIALRPNSSFAYFMLGNTEAGQGHFAAAMPNFQKVAELEPKSFIGPLFLSACAEKLGHKQEAIDYAKRTTAMSPAFVGGWIQLARAERTAGHQQETLAAVHRAAELSPDNAYLLATVGYGYINLNRISDAIPPLQHAAQIAPRDFLVQSQLGYC